jgi:hypothetical protein
LAASFRTFSAITEKNGLPKVRTENPIVPLLFAESSEEVAASSPGPHPEKIRQRQTKGRVKIERRDRFMNFEDLG